MLGKLYANYFPIKLVKTTELDPEKVIEIKLHGLQS